MPHDHSHHGHSHGGAGHSHAPPDFGRAYAIGIVLNVGYVVLEVTFGLISGSLALLADAGHNLSDVLGLLLAWGATWLAKRRPTAQRTYGYKRGPILASLANAVILLVAVGVIVWEAIHRLITPELVASGTIIWVAAIGVFVNAGTAWLFMSGRKGDLNIRGAFLHMAADAGVTVGVIIIAALLIQWTSWHWIDPAISLVIAIVILVGTWGLHIWGMSTTETALTIHLVRAEAGSDGELLHRIMREVRERFEIGHPTIQMETPEAAKLCGLRPDNVV